MAEVSELELQSKRPVQQDINPQGTPDSHIVEKFHLLRQSVDLSAGLAISKERRKSSRRSSRLVSSYVDHTTVITEVKEGSSKDGPITKVPLDKDEIKQIEVQGQGINKMDEHYVNLDILALRYNISLTDGHTETQAAMRNRVLGDNKLSEKKKTPWWIKFLEEMFQPFSILLWIASVMCFALYFSDPGAPGAISNLYLAIILIIIILVTGTITFQQGAKSEALMDGFKNLLPRLCQVVRDGQVKQIESLKLVPGDIVIISAGKQIPADLRIIQSQSIKVDNSPLTGEAEPQPRVAECTNIENITETKNVAFFGTLCKEGNGKGIVFNIGDNTMMGKIAELTTGGAPPTSPLKKELGRFVILISILAVSMGVALFFLSLYLRNAPFGLAVSQAIGIIVANVPEGLLGCITISLAITAKTLSEKMVLVKNLEAVETLGSTSCICSDKTGTLTQNKMTVENIWYDQVKRRALNRQKHGDSVEYEYNVGDPTFREIQECSMTTSVAYFQVQTERTDNIIWQECPVDGDASETALVKFFQPLEDIKLTRQKRPLAIIPPDNIPARMAFNSTNKYSLCIVDWETNDSYYCVYIQGAPEKLWILCSTLLVEGRNERIDENVTKQFQQINLTFGKNGERVLGFAKLHLPKQSYPKGTKFDVNSSENLNFPMEDFTFLGLISLIDPPKDTVKGAIRTCQSAGIKVIMVTGDQPPTAGAIAKQIGIITGKTVDDILDENPQMSYDEAFRLAPAIVVHGDMIREAMDEEQELQEQKKLTEEMKDRKLLSWCSKPQVVFARTSPAQKLLIVRACQSLGHVVGVTGDGVNDSPAIKQGDIGISMGISGSDVTKDAADMILMDDDFSSIVVGVQEGRKIFDNLKKTVVYILTSNITEIFPYIAQIGFGLPLPLSNIFILVICIGTDILPAVSFAYEDAEIDIMTRSPRKKTDHLVSLKLITHAYMLQGQIATAAGFFAYFATMDQYGFSPSTLFSLQGASYVTLPFPSGIQPTKFDYTMPTLNNPMLSANPLNFDPQVASNKILGYSDLWSNSPLNWDDENTIYYDLRYVFVNWDSSQNRWFPAFSQWNTADNDCKYWSQNDSILKNSDYSDLIETTPCFKVATLKYAQTSYFVAVIMVQWSNVFACKQRKMSLVYSPINVMMFYGVLSETLMFIVIIYIPGINNAFGARPVDIFNLGMPGLPFSICLLLWEEIRKYLIRNCPPPNKKTPNWFELHSLW